MQLTILCCHNSLYGTGDVSSTPKLVLKGVNKIEMPCSSRIDPIHILKAFENGADGVVVIACADEACTLLRGSRHLKRRVKYAQLLLEEAGVDPQRVFYFEPEVPSAPKLEQIVTEAKAALEKIGCGV
ncbi:hydrogenase iron-sulfur subunit [bacterium]